MLLSIVSPVYHAENIIKELVNRIKYEIDILKIEYEIILIEDGSEDNSWIEIENLCYLYSNIIGVKLSRNFGQHYAISAGLKYAKGDVIVVMDCDLQDNPKYIPYLILEYKKGFDIVYTEKQFRNHSFFKNLTSSFYNLFFNYLIDNKNWKSNINVGTYSLLSRKVVDSFNSINDYHRHYLIVLRWLGYSHTKIIINHDKRFSGKSSYTLNKLIKHAIEGITSQSDKLLRISVLFGLVITGISFISILLILFFYFSHGFRSGWTSIFVLILFSTGIIVTSIGIAGIYIGKIFDQVKMRPMYIIEKVLNP